MKYKCPCCGKKTLIEEPHGTYQICPICHWEDDYVQFMSPDYIGGANKKSLNETRKEFQKARYEYLKKINQKKLKEKKWKNNVLFMEFLQSIKEIKIISEKQSKEILDNVYNRFNLYDSGHVIWNTFKGKQEIVSYSDLTKYINIDNNYYIIWDNNDIPMIKCTLKSVIANVDDTEAVSINFLIVSEDYNIILESKKTGYVHMGIFE